MMAMDLGHSQSDKELAKLEKKIAKQYEQAHKTIDKKVKDYFKKFDKEDKQKTKLLKKGKITQDEYIKWFYNKTMTGENWTALRDTLAQDLSHSNQIAASLINKTMPDVYALNANYGMFEIESGLNINTSFSLYDHFTVERLIKEKDPGIIPKAKVDIPKDLRWNRTKITSAMTQGILAGESIPDIAKRLQKVTDMNQSAAIRNARTYTTAAEGAGRTDSYEYAEDLGIELEQEWLATPDDRTRQSHIDLDGERIPVGGVFPNGCRYPGDPLGAPEEIYNCRCRLVAALKGYDYAKGHRFTRLPDGMDYDDWKYGKKNAEIKDTESNIADLKQKLSGLPDNKTYSGIWKDDVTLADYEAKKDSIEGKADFYNQEIDKFKNDPSYKPWMSEYAKQDKIDLYSQYLKDLEEFKKLGPEYQKALQYQKELAEAEKHLKELKGVKNASPFSPDMYSEETKRLARLFTDPDAADALYRPYLDSIWNSLDDRQKYALWEYTQNSNPINKSLSGYHDGWSRSDFVGLGNTDWNHEKPWRYVPSEFSRFGDNGHVEYHRAITDLTNAIEKSTLPESAYFVRGSDTGGLAGLISDGFSGIDFDDIKRALDSGDKETVKKLLEGQTFTSHSFLSTGIAEGTGFSGDVKYKIYAPQGTKAIYAEPQSYYGNTHSYEAVLYKPGDNYDSIGYEAEMLFQRGTSFRVTKVEYNYGDYVVHMEVVDQPNYFKFGDEETFNRGATRHVDKNF